MVSTAATDLKRTILFPAFVFYPFLFVSSGLRTAVEVSECSVERGGPWEY